MPVTTPTGRPSSSSTRALLDVQLDEGVDVVAPRLGEPRRVEPDRAIASPIVTPSSSRTSSRCSRRVSPVIAREPQKLADGKREPSSSHSETTSSVRRGRPTCSFSARTAATAATIPSAPS